MTEDDISHPNVHIDLNNLKYNYLKRLIFRGDTMHENGNLKDAQIRVFHYFENETDKRIVDPTPKKVWLRKKAEKLGVILTPLWKEETLSNVPAEADISNPTDLTGWSKSLNDMQTSPYKI